VSATPVPHGNVPAPILQLPLDEIRVKLVEIPVSVYVANVWVDQVPRERRPPVEDAWIVACAGSEPPGTPVGGA
jgi:hypothetical protein